MSKTAKRMVVLALLTFTIVLLVVVAVYFYGTLSHTEKNETFNLNDIEQASNLEEMVTEADMIVAGAYEGLHSTVNLARDEKDMTKESTTEYMGGKVYRFHIDKVLKGETNEDIIRIVHRYSDVFPIGETLGHKDEEVEREDPTFIKPSFGKTYVVFVNNPEVEDFYTQSMEPYMIAVNTGDIVEMKSNIEEELKFDDQFSGESLAELEAKIEKLK